jgi:hypothetical protein
MSTYTGPEGPILDPHMSDPLDPNPGNLRKHFVEDPEFRTRVRGPYKDTDPTAVTMSDHPMPKEEQRAPLNDEQIIAGASDCFQQHVNTDAPLQKLNEADYKAFMIGWHEGIHANITSGELMVVKTARIEGAKRACSSCGVEWPLLAIPAIGDHCICGAKIIP